jgi:nucleoside-diphosphate-sugar epimerase
VRSEEKSKDIKSVFPDISTQRLGFALVPDITMEGAFDAVIQKQAFDAVIHTASPVSFNISDPKKDLIDPAVNGTQSILQSIHLHAPSVKRVIITSSFAAMKDDSKGNWPEHTYSEADWNPVTLDYILNENPGKAYSASKTFAEKAAWKFMDDTKPKFTLTAINPPWIYGPMRQRVQSLDHVNASSQAALSFTQGTYKNEMPGTPLPIFIDVRDAALAHVLALESPDFAGKRLFAVTSHFFMRDMAEVIRKNFPQYADKLPAPELGSELPKEDVYAFDNSELKKLFKNERDLITFEKSITDLVHSFQEVGK